MNKYSIGIDLGGTKILTAIVDNTTGEVLCYTKIKTKRNKSEEKIIRKIIKSIKEVLNEAQKDISEIDSIGIGAAGQTNREKGIIINAPNIGIENLNIKEILEKEFNKTVFLGNDVEVAAVAEILFGGGKDEKDFICIFVGTGVGSCIVQDGKIRHGATGNAGEIGHIIIEYNGRKCGCGANGCLEAYASRLAIEKRIIEELNKGMKSDITNYIKENKPIKTAMLRKALNNNDETTRLILDEASSYLATGIASIINFYNPSKIVLGGGLINGIDYFYERTIELTKERTLKIASSGTKFDRARLGDFAGAIGAAMIKEYRTNFSWR